MVILAQISFWGWLIAVIVAAAGVILFLIAAGGISLAAELAGLSDENKNE